MDAFLEMQHNASTSDVTVHVLPALSDGAGGCDAMQSDRPEKSYHMHAFVLRQSGWFARMLDGTDVGSDRPAQWRESAGSQRPAELRVRLFRDGWIEEDVLDAFFESFYVSDLSARTAVISALKFPLHELAEMTLHDRLAHFCEAQIENDVAADIDPTSVASVIGYCQQHGLRRTEDMCVRWLQAFGFVSEAFASPEAIAQFDLTTVARVVSGSDTMGNPVGLMNLGSCAMRAGGREPSHESLISSSLSRISALEPMRTRSDPVCFQFFCRDPRLPCRKPPSAVFRAAPGDDAQMRVHWEHARGHDWFFGLVRNGAPGGSAAVLTLLVKRNEEGYTRMLHVHLRAMLLLKRETVVVRKDLDVCVNLGRADVELGNADDLFGGAFSRNGHPIIPFKVSLRVKSYSRTDAA